jgi:hypothetical protein
MGDPDRRGAEEELMIARHTLRVLEVGGGVKITA